MNALRLNRYNNPDFRMVDVIRAEIMGIIGVN